MTEPEIRKLFENDRSGSKEILIRYIEGNLSGHYQNSDVRKEWHYFLKGWQAYENTIVVAY